MRSSAPRACLRAALSGSALLLLTLLPLPRAAASQAVTLDTGYGLDDTRLLRVNFSAGDNWRTPGYQGWSWNRFWEANLSYWYLYRRKQGEADLYELGITPNFRAERERTSAWGRPYLEVGVGIHLLSKVQIGPRDLGSTVQFGSHVGIGFMFGEGEQWELAWRYEHLSNGGLQEPNPGINFGMVRLGYRW